MSSLPVVLPERFTPNVAVGDTITVSQPIATKKKTSDTVTINIAEELSLPVAKVGKAIVKNPGESVNPGDVIAVKSGLMGMGKQKVVSSVSGKILSFERRTGSLIMELERGEATGDEASASYLSPVDGTVTAIEDGKIIIETEKDTIVGEKGTGGTIRAEVFSIGQNTDETVPLHLLTVAIIGKILLGREFNRDGLLKAIGMGTGGLIVNRIAEEDLDYVRKKHSTFPLIQVGAEQITTLEKWAGKQAYLDGDKKNIVLLHV